jgi:ribosomal-protein-alanine N-acetyltransferase
MTDRISIPVLHTPRLRLRGVQSGDEDALYDLLSDERVVRYTLFPVFTRERAARFVERVQAPPAAGEPPAVAFAITERGDDTLVGLCGLVLRPEAEEAEVWYVLRPASWGKGLVTEAAGAVVDYGFRELALHRTWASCLPVNPASVRVLEKLGFRREGLLRQNLRIHGEWRDSYLYAVLADEWGVVPG